MNKIITSVFVFVFVFSMQAQVIITGVMYDPRGYDAQPAGETKGLTKKDPHKGGFEYIQLMATEDIDFSKKPFSVVVCSNAGSFGGAPYRGWAEGGDRTFKFNLKKGKASKGTFFYVGGPEMRLSGHGRKFKSVDISDANWIRTIVYNDGTKNKVGDDFGNARGGLLPNSGNPVGVAVFKGTKVSHKSAPIDAIFYGTQKKLTKAGRKAVFEASDNSGYRIPNNDRYQQEDKEGNKQAFFGEGSNSFTFMQQTHEALNIGKDSGNFLMLGGTYNADTKKWEKKRTTYYVTLFPDASEVPTATIADIETGDMVTKLITK